MPFGRRFLVGTGGLDHLPDAFCPEKPLSAPAHPTRSPKYLPPRGAGWRGGGNRRPTLAAHRHLRDRRISKYPPLKGIVGIVPRADPVERRYRLNWDLPHLLVPNGTTSVNHSREVPSSKTIEFTISASLISFSATSKSAVFIA